MARHIEVVVSAVARNRAPVAVRLYIALYLVVIRAERVRKEDARLARDLFEPHTRDAEFFVYVDIACHGNVRYGM